jgi:hypothetical protein
VLAVLVFLVVSGLLARFFTVENVEREDEQALIEDQTRGDANAIIAKLHDCSSSPACVARARANASSLRRPGAVKIVSVKASNAGSLTGKTGTTRLAWTVLGSPPVVQCVKVRRTGNFLVGIKVTMLSLSAPIPNEGVCGKRSQIEVEEEEATEVER